MEVLNNVVGDAVWTFAGEWWPGLDAQLCGLGGLYGLFGFPVRAGALCTLACELCTLGGL